MSSLRTPFGAAAIILSCAFALIAVGSVWVIFTPEGTGVNFPAGLLYLLGLVTGVVGLVFTIVGLFRRQ